MQKPSPNSHENVLDAGDFIVSKTDLYGKIIYPRK